MKKVLDTRTTRLRLPRRHHSSTDASTSIASRAQRFVTTAKRPLYQARDNRRSITVSIESRSEIFFAKGLDTAANQLEGRNRISRATWSQIDFRRDAHFLLESSAFCRR